MRPDLELNPSGASAIGGAAFPRVTPGHDCTTEGLSIASAARLGAGDARGAVGKDGFGEAEPISDGSIGPAACTPCSASGASGHRAPLATTVPICESKSKPMP